MPYSLTLPNGFVVNNIPDNVPRGQALENLKAKMPDAFPAPPGIGQQLLGLPAEIGKGFIRGLTVDPASGIASLGYTGARAAGADLVPFEQTGVGKGLAGLQKSLAPSDEGLITQFGGGLGSLLSFIPGGLLKGGIGLATKLTQAGGVGSEEARARAEEARVMGEADATAGQQFMAQLGGTGVGFSELAPLKFLTEPIEQILRGVPKSQADLIAPTLFNSGKRMLATGGIEGFQEGMANIAQDLIAKGIYNPNLQVGESALGDAAMGASVGAFAQGAIELATRGKRRALYEQFKEQEEAQKQAEAQRIAAEQQAALAAQERQQQQLAMQALGGPQIDPATGKPVLLLGGPAPQVNLQDPLGIRFGEEDLGPKVVAGLNQARKKKGLPSTQQFTIEDLMEAGSEKDAPIVSEMLARKTGFDPSVQVSPQSVLEVAQSKNIDVESPGFTDFLRRTTGSADIGSMTAPQLFAAQQSLSALPNFTEPTQLPTGSQATTFDDKTYKKTVDGLKKTVLNSGPLGKAKVIEEIKGFSGLTETRDAERLLETALGRGDLSASPTKGLVGTSINISLPTLPGIGGPDVRRGDYMDSEVTGYEITSEDGKFKQVRPTMTAAENSLAAAEEGRLNTVTKLTDEANRTQLVLESNQEKLAELDQLGETGAQYKKIESNIKNLTSKLNRLNDKIQSASQPLQIKARQTPRSRAGFTLFENGQPVGTYPTQEDAQIAAVRFRTDEELDGIINAAPRTSMEGALEQPFGEQPVQRGTVRSGMARRLYDEAVKEKDRRYRTQAGLPPPAAPVQIKITGDAVAAAERLRAAGLTVRFAPEVEKEVPEINKRLRAVLDRLGLKDVRLNIVESMKVPGFAIYDQRGKLKGFIKKVEPNSPEFAKNMATIAQARAMGMRVEESVAPANGSYAAKLIEIALDSENPIRAARHEAIHALKELGFFTPDQWRVLENKAKSEWIKKYQIESRYSDLDQEGQIEEAIADAFSDFDQNKPPVGTIGNLFRKVKAFFEALGNAFRGSGFQTAEEVFTRVEEGRLTGPGATGVTGAEATRYSVPSLSKGEVDAISASMPNSALMLIDNYNRWAQAFSELPSDVKNKLDALYVSSRKTALTAQDPGYADRGARAAQTRTFKAASQALEKHLGRELNPDELSLYLTDWRGSVDEALEKPPSFERNKYSLGAVRDGLKKFSIGRTSDPAINIITGETARPDFGKKPTVEDVGNYFDNLIKDEFGGSLDFKNPEHFDRAIRIAVQELQYQRELENSGIDWYDKDIADAFEITVQVLPQLSSPTKRNLFNVMAGIMSPGTNARDNWFITSKAFKHYLDTGIIPSTNPENNKLWQGGLESANKKKQLDMLNAMVQDMGESAATTWVYSDHPVSEINEFRSKYGGFKSKVSGKADAEKVGMLAFGPKVGPFIANINGIHAETIDRWMIRTFNRYFGTMVDAKGNMMDVPTGEPQRRAAQELLRRVGDELGVRPYQAQSMLWFFEQSLFRAMGTPATSYGFSDGAKRYRDDTGTRRGVEEGRRLGASTDEERVARLDELAGRPSDSGVEAERDRDRGRRDQGRGITPLEGTPVVQGATGPDPNLVNIAEQYAQDKNIPYRRQGEYVVVNPEFSTKVAREYDEMVHNPQNPKVREAYDDLIRQTLDQYNALVDNGYSFTFYDSNTDPYDGNPFNAMRDLRANKRMAVYGTYAGYGTEGITGAEVANNPMLEDTGLRWPDQAGNPQVVTANDLFRVVHDAFGHGLEGAGFRARGEENAFQAHARLFTGPALGALASETRGQNSWLNFGPYGEQNANAKVLDTVFAEQKTGLMPGWTWTTNMAPDIGDKKLSLNIAPIKGISIREQQPTAQSFDAVHYGKQPVNTLLGSMYGTGIRGAEAQRVFASEDPRVQQRAYFYIPLTNGRMPMPEAGLGNQVHVQRLNNLLGPGPEMQALVDATRGPDGRMDANAFESAVIDAGYDGYAVPDMGMAVVLDANVPVISRGTRQEVESMPEEGKIQIGDRKYSLRPIETPEFKQWFGESKIVNADSTPKVMYHGTARDVSEFRPKQADAIFLTEDPDFAENFTDNSEIYMVQELFNKTFTPEQRLKMVRESANRLYKNKDIDRNTRDQAIDRQTNADRKLGSSFINSVIEDDLSSQLREMLPTRANIMPLYVQAENPFDYDNPEHVQRVVEKLNEQTDSWGRKVGDKRKQVLDMGDWEEIESSQVQEAIKELGFDSFYVREGGIKNLAVYDPNQIKSAIGNFGTFSRTNDDIRYSIALGSLEPRTALIPDLGGNPDGTLGNTPDKFGSKPIRMTVGTHNDITDKGYGANHVLNRVLNDSDRMADLDMSVKEVLERILVTAQKTAQNYSRIYRDPKTNNLAFYTPKNTMILSEDKDQFSIVTMYKVDRPDQTFGQPLWQGRAPVVPQFVGKIKGTEVVEREGRVQPKAEIKVSTKPKRVYTPTEIEQIAAGEPTKGTLSLKKKMSLRVPDRTVTKFFDDQEQIPMSGDVEIIRDNWIGGVSGIGDRDSAYYLNQVDGGPEYIQQVQDLVRRDLGESFKGYRLMSQEEVEELQTGSMGTQLASISLDPETALAIASIPQYSRRPKGDLVVVELDLTPEHVQMVGHVPEKELVIDYGVGYNPTAVEPIVSPVKFSLAGMKPIDTNSDNFKNWFGKSKIVDKDGKPKVMYHGTDQDILEFIPGDSGIIFVSPTSDFAGIFTKYSEERSLKKLANKLDNEPEQKRKFLESAIETSIADDSLASADSPYYQSLVPLFFKYKDLEKYTKDYWLDLFMSRRMSENMSSTGLKRPLEKLMLDALPTGRNILPVYVSAQNPFDYDNRSHVIKVMKKLASMDSRYTSGTPTAKAIRNDILNGRWQEIENTDVQEAIKELGFDSFYAMEQDTKNLGLFSPNQIKSAVSNTGDFSLADPRISYSLAGLTPTDSKDNMIYLLQDKNIDLKRVIQAIQKSGKDLADRWNAYLQEELFHGRSATRVRFFMDRELRPFLQKMEAANVSVEQMDDYLLARHAKEANAYLRKINPDPSQNSGMTDKEAEDYMASLPPQRRMTLERLAKEVDAFTKGTRDLMVDYGLEDRKTINQWEKTYKNYVPLFREEIEEGMPISIGRGYQIRGATTRRRMGSSRKVSDILANIALQRERTIVRGEKNRVGNSLYGLVLDNPNKGFWAVINPEKMSKQALRTELLNLGINPDAVDEMVARPPQRVINKTTGLVSYQVPPMWKNAPNIFATRINGEDRFIAFNEKDERAMRMASTLKNLDAQQQGEAVRMMGTAGDYYRKMIDGTGKVTRYFAQINTQYNPAFGIYNLMRDIGGAVLNLQTTPLKGQEAKVISDALVALKSVYRDLRRQREGLDADSEWAKIFEEFELEGGKTGYRDLFETRESRAEALQKEIEDFNKGTVRSKGKAIMGWLSDFNDAIENSIRVSVYKNAIDKGISKERAASLAKNITVNFNRTGAVSRNFQTLFAFFNASIQGTARIAQTLLTSEGKLSPTGKKIVMGGITLGLMQAVLLAMAGLDDDEVPDFVKDKSFVIPTGDGKYIAIPMPLGYNIIPGFGRRVMEFAMSDDKNVGKAVAETSQMIVDGFNPLGSGTFVQTLTPTALDPIVALAENKDFTGKPISREDINSLSPTPGYTRGSQNSFAVTEALAYAINILSGGTEFKKGVLSPTPDQIEYLIGEALGGVGREALKIGRGVEAIATGEELATYNIPIAGRLVGNVQQQAAQRNRFFENIRRLNEHQAEIEGRMLNGEDINDYLETFPEATMYQVGDKVYNQITKLRQQRKALEAAGVGKEELKVIDEAVLGLMTSLNEIYSSAKQQ